MLLKKIKTLLPLCIICVLIFSVSFYFMSYGTFKFLAPATRSVSYDSLGKSLLNFEFDVEPSTINWEGYDINGKKYMYFGPFPAFVRIVLNKIYIQGYGLWSRVSSLIAIMLITLSAYFIFKFALQHNKNITHKLRPHIAMLTTFCLVFGTPIFYLTSCTRIYNEAMMWGVAWGICSIAIYYYLVNKRQSQIKFLILYGIAISFTLLSRVTFALPLYALCIYLCLELYKQRHNWIKKSFFLCGTASLGGIFQLIYNYKRFGNIFISAPEKIHYWDTVKKYGYFSFNRLYDGLTTFLIPSQLNFKSNFPFFVQNIHDYKNAYLYPDWKESYIAITLSCLVFSFLIVYFTCKVIKYFIKRHEEYDSHLINPHSVCIFFLVMQALLISATHFLTERYIAEFVPLIFYLMILFLAKVKSRYVVNSFCILILCSIGITIFSTISELMYFRNDDFPESWMYLWNHIPNILF